MCASEPRLAAYVSFAMGDWMKWGNDMASYAKNAASQASVLVAGTDLDKKLAEATSNEPWGASGAAALFPEPLGYHHEVVL